jgi:hypothetical protein
MLRWLREKYRRDTDTTGEAAVLGNAAGIVYVPGRTGFVYVRRQASDGSYTDEAQARGPTANVKTAVNRFVTLGYTNNILHVTGVSFDAELTAGQNPMINNAADPLANKWTDQATIKTAYCHAVQGTMTAAVRVWPVLYRGKFYIAQGNVDLTSYVPSSGKHRLVLVYADQSLDILAAGSDEQATGIPLSLTDMNEAYSAATDVLAPIWFWYLASSTTALSNADYPDGNKWIDARQIINLDAAAQTSEPLYDENMALITDENSELVYAW